MGNFYAESEDSFKVLDAEDAFAFLKLYYGTILREVRGEQ